MYGVQSQRDSRAMSRLVMGKEQRCKVYRPHLQVSNQRPVASPNFPRQWVPPHLQHLAYQPQAAGADDLPYVVYPPSRAPVYVDNQEDEEQQLAEEELDALYLDPHSLGFQRGGSVRLSSHPHPGSNFRRTQSIRHYTLPTREAPPPPTVQKKKRSESPPQPPVKSSATASTKSSVSGKVFTH